jgi:hypothetical protein
MSLQGLLEEEFLRRGIHFSVEAEAGRYVIERSGGKLHIALDNLRRDYERDKDTSRVSGFVETVLQATKPLGAWAEGRSSVFFAFEPSDYLEPSPLRTPVSDHIDRVPVHFDPSRGTITWLDQSQLDTWQVSLEDLAAEALANLARILAEAELKHFEIDGVRIGYFETVLSFKTSLLCAPNLKEVAAPVLGWPLFAVLPDRDFVYLWDAAQEDMLRRLGAVVVKEYKAASYPLTTEVFRIWDERIEAIGAYPLD